ncbi:hypothetical protein HMPREF9120_01058 [Neisseria sp. oral taxon 020 str. F0370]|nr:hypothetical protein HMPREF9120_01058 [Neisseria sp. oral taxon 020 str. F0370]
MFVFAWSYSFFTVRIGIRRAAAANLTEFPRRRKKNFQTAFSGAESLPL